MSGVGGEQAGDGLRGAFGDNLGALSTNALSKSVVVVAGRDVVSCDMAGGAALLNVRSGVYFTLNDVGARIWSAIQTPKAVSEIVDTITALYDVDRHRCHDDLVVLLQQLDDAGLINILASPNPQVSDAEQVG